MANFLGEAGGLAPVKYFDGIATVFGGGVGRQEGATWAMPVAKSGLKVGPVDSTFLGGSELPFR